MNSQKSRMLKYTNVTATEFNPGGIWTQSQLAPTNQMDGMLTTLPHWPLKNFTYNHNIIH